MARFDFFALLVAVASALPSNTPEDVLVKQNVVPKREYSEPSSASERAQAVVDAFRVSWDGYYKYAFPMDELRPVNNTGSNSR